MKLLVKHPIQCDRGGRGVGKKTQNLVDVVNECSVVLIQKFSCVILNRIVHKIHKWMCILSSILISFLLYIPFYGGA